VPESLAQDRLGARAQRCDDLRRRDAVRDEPRALAGIDVSYLVPAVALGPRELGRDGGILLAVPAAGEAMPPAAITGTEESPSATCSMSSVETSPVCKPHSRVRNVVITSG
jgi:hypothetical protein